MLIADQPETRAWLVAAKASIWAVVRPPTDRIAIRPNAVNKALILRTLPAQPGAFANQLDRIARLTALVPLSESTSPASTGRVRPKLQTPATIFSGQQPFEGYILNGSPRVEWGHLYLQCPIDVSLGLVNSQIAEVAGVKDRTVTFRQDDGGTPEGETPRCRACATVAQKGAKAWLALQLQCWHSRANRQ